MKKAPKISEAMGDNVIASATPLKPISLDSIAASGILSSIELTTELINVRVVRPAPVSRPFWQKLPIKSNIPAANAQKRYAGFYNRGLIGKYPYKRVCKRENYNKYYCIIGIIIFIPLTYASLIGLLRGSLMAETVIAAAGKMANRLFSRRFPAADWITRKN